MTTTITGFPSSAGPAGDSLQTALADGQSDTIILALPTPTGLKGKTYTPAGFARVREHGAGMSAYLLATDTDMTPDPGYPWLGAGTGDLIVKPDPAAVYRAAWRARTALVLGDALDPGGTPTPHAPREVLRRQLERLTQLGISALLGIESEARAYRLTHRDAHQRGYRHLHREAAGEYNGDYALEHPRDLQALLDALTAGLNDSGLELEAIKTEAGRGQIEPTFLPAEPLTACDRHAIFKTAARQIAETHGMALTFMAKPHSDQDGSGCHLHLSLTAPNGRPLFAGTDRRLGTLARRALAGCLALLGDLAPLYAPNINSYKRYGPMFTPTMLDWGFDDRTRALRITGHGDGRRIECRLPGADTQPHLAAAALLAAVAHGIEQELTLDDPPSQDPVERLPRDLAEAAARFHASLPARKALGDEVVEHYTHAARGELDAHHRHVGTWELERGFARA